MSGRNRSPMGVALALLIVVSSPARADDKSLSGAEVTCSPRVLTPGATLNLRLTVDLTAGTDDWVSGMQLDLPPGLTVLGATDLEGGIAPLVWDGQTGDGATLTWSDPDGGSGNLRSGDIGQTVVAVTVVDPPVTSVLEWVLFGDGAGDPPHDRTGYLHLDLGAGNAGWLPGFAGPGVDPDEEDWVEAACVFQGQWVVAGNIDEASGVPVQSIAAWDGETWRALGEGIAGTVHALAVHEGELYAGGDFTGAGGVTARRLARWDGAVWRPCGTGLNNGLDGPVHALLSTAEGLVVGGDFSSAGLRLAENVALWTGGWQAYGDGLDAPVRALAEHDGQLIAGGDFTHSGMIPASHLAAWSGAFWATFQGGADGPVLDLAAEGEKLFVVGDFAACGGVACANLGLWNGKAWDTTLGAGADAPVLSVQRFLGRWYVGGSFGSISGSAVDCFAEWTGETWYEGRNNPLGAPSCVVHDFAVDPGQGIGTGTERLLIAGRFSGGNNQSRDLLWYDWHDWFYAVGSGLYASVVSRVEVSALQRLDDQLYVGGSFDGFVNSYARMSRFLARWDGAEWSEIELSGPVHAMAVVDGCLVVGGDFYESGGYNIIRRDGTWVSMGGLGEMEDEATVYCLHVMNGILYAGGLFERSDGTILNNVARWSPPDAWVPVGSGFDGPVYALASVSSLGYEVLCAGGDFTHTGDGVRVDNLASYGGGAWHRLGDETNPGADGPVHALLGRSGNLVVGGEFTSICGTSASRIVSYNRATGHWSPLGEGFEGTVLTLGLNGDALVAGGHTLRLAGGVQHLMSWDGDAWQGFGTGPDDYVNCLADWDGDLMVGGVFEVAGGACSAGIARWRDDMPTAVRPHPEIPSATLAPNVPNPFNPATEVRFDLPRAADVRLDVYDLRGRRIARIVDGWQEAGEHRRLWRGRDERGQPVAAGAYILRLQTETGVRTRKIMMVR